MFSGGSDGGQNSANGFLLAFKLRLHQGYRHFTSNTLYGGIHFEFPILIIFPSVVIFGRRSFTVRFAFAVRSSSQHTEHGIMTGVGDHQQCETLECTLSDFVAQASGLIRGYISEAVAEHGSCILGLSGGSTPGPVYLALAQDVDVPWDKIHVFLVDERHVADTSKDANFALVKETILDVVGSRIGSCVFPNTKLDPAACALDYGHRLQSQLFSKRNPDVLVMGMGPDFHTASLFPPVDASVWKSADVAIHTVQERGFAVRDRITLSLNELCKASRHIFLIKSKERCQQWGQMLQKPYDVVHYPVHGMLAKGKSVVVLSQ
eukprot:ANDGO_08565.mRNA.1 putative 6-phosphogluconolactonase